MAERVICIKCHDEGYTASPDYVPCKCGGKLVVVSKNNEEIQEEIYESLTYTA